MNNAFVFSAANVVFEHKLDNMNGVNVSMRHCHDDYEILYVLRGKGRYLIEGAEFEMQPRTLVFIRPFEYHFVEVKDVMDYDRYVINFSSSALPKEMKSIFDKMIGEMSTDSGIFYSPENISSGIMSIFDRFEYASSVPEPERELYVKFLLSELLIHLSVSKKQLIAHNDLELGARVAKYINDYIERTHSLDQLAKRFFVSKYYLCHTFKKYSGVSIHSYINHKRVLYAKQLIEAGETASGAAYKVGFGDYSAFYRAYVKILGVPPTSETKKRGAEKKRNNQEEKK